MRDLSNEIISQVNKDGFSYMQFKCLLDFGIKHAYSLKNEDLYFSHSSIKSARERENYRRLCDTIGVDVNNLVRPKQKHTDVIRRVDDVYNSDYLNDIDGLITNKSNIVLATTNADCILYLLYDKKKRVIGNIHSGWRGSYQRIIEKAIDKMISEYGSCPEDIIVCICPSIRRCCFEVDKDVRDIFYDKFSFLENIGNFVVNGYVSNKFFIDTVGINNCLLKNKGIKEENIYDCNICSVCNKDLIHSYRGDGKVFKLASAIISL